MAQKRVTATKYPSAQTSNRFAFCKAGRTAKPVCSLNTLDVVCEGTRFGREVLRWNALSRRARFMGKSTQSQKRETLTVKKLTGTQCRQQKTAIKTDAGLSTINSKPVRKLPFQNRLPWNRCSKSCYLYDLELAALFNKAVSNRTIHFQKAATQTTHGARAASSCRQKTLKHSIECWNLMELKPETQSTAFYRRKYERNEHENGE